MKELQEKNADVAQIRTLIWMCAVAKLDRISNERSGGTTKVGKIYKKVPENSLKCYGHVMRRRMCDP